MNDTAQTAAGQPPQSDDRGAAQAEEGSSTTLARPSAGPSFFERLSSLFRQRNGVSLREDLADALAGSELDGEAFSPGERAMLNNILRLREVRVEDVMVPRAEIEAIDITTTLGRLLVLFEESGHSRMPVYADNLDDPRGMVHIRDAVAHLTRVGRGAAQQPATPDGPEPSLDLGRVDLDRTIGELNLVRPVLFVPPSMLASDLMARMQAQRIQMALVIDEYGGTDGLASLEDIVEMVVGDIEDEHDEEETLVVAAADGTFVVDAKAEIEDVAAAIGEAFAVDAHAEDVDTIGGLVFNVLGRVPERGEVVHAVPGFDFQVLDADPRRIKKVRIVDTRHGDRRRRSERLPPAGY